MRITRRSVLAAAALSAGAAHAQPSGGERLTDIIVRTRAARLAGDVTAWRAGAERALTLAPEHPDLLISAARACAASGDLGAAMTFAGQASARGAGFELAQFPEFAPLDLSGDAALVVQRARANLAPVPGGARFADLPGPDCEGIAYDAEYDRFFTGSSDGRIFAVGFDGRVTTFASGLHQVRGMKVDIRRRRLWAISGRFPNLFAQAPEPDVGTCGVRAFNLDDGSVTGAWDIDERPTLHGFNDLVIARNGDVYITDSPTGSVFWIQRGTGELEPLVQSDTLSFVNGVVLTPNQRRLYVAHIEGISVIDVRRRTVERLAVPANASVNSIDGLAWLDGAIVGVQPSPYLDRLARIRLDASGGAVSSVSAVIARTPAEYGYTTCAVGERAVYLVGGIPAPNVYGGPALVSAPSPHIWRVPV